MTLVYLAAAWVAGIALARALHPAWQLLALLGLMSIWGLLVASNERHVRLTFLSLLLFALGAGRFLLALPHFDARSLVTYNDVGWVTLEGVVVREPDEREAHTNLRLRAQWLTLPDGTVRQVQGRILAQAPRYPRRAYGDRLRLTGSLQTPPVYESFSYRDYLARQHIYSYMEPVRIEALEGSRARPLAGSLFALKGRAQTVIAAMLPEPQAALLSGILLGVETGIPEELMHDFEATGTAHIIAISGFNVTMVSGLFAGLAGRFLHRRSALLTAVGGVAVYTILVGASAAVVRAALMGILYLFGRYVGRKSYAPVSLALAAMIMTAWNPHNLWDRGFQLSFAATAGLLFYAEPLERALESGLSRVTSVERAQRLVGAVSEGLLVTIASLITTAPLILRFSQRLSPVTLLTNLLVLPMQPWVMFSGGLAAVLGLIVPPAGRIIAWVAWLLLSYTIELVRLTARLPVPFLLEDGSPPLIWAYYAVVGLTTWWLVQPGRRRRALRRRLRAGLRTRLDTKLLLGASTVLLALAVFAWARLPDGRLHVHVLDVGQGDAIFIQTPAGRQVLIDGGPRASVLLSRLGRRMPFWDRSLDLVVLTHPDADHISGLVRVLERYRVEAVVYRPLGCQDATCRRWQQLLRSANVKLHRGEVGLKVNLGDGVQLEVLHPALHLLPGEGFNDNSLVTRVTYGPMSLLLTGDIEAEAEKVLLTSGVDLESTVLKVAHHGACGSTTQAFLEAVDPQVAVISVGEGNKHDHPCDAVLDRLEAVLPDGPDRLYRTDLHGTVELVSEGTRLWVETRPRP